MNSKRRNIININRLAVALAIVLFVSGAIANAQESFSIRFSGSLVLIGASSDTTATLLFQEGISLKFGNITNQSLLEFGTPSPAKCPNGNNGSKAPLVSGSFVNRAPDGSLFFGKFDSGTSCLVLPSTLFLSLDGTITGGTGRFDGATGTFTSNNIRVKLLTGGMAMGQFGSVLLNNVSGTITLP